MDQVTEIDAAAGTIIERPLTPDEAAQREKDEADHAAAVAAAEAAAVERAAARAALLERLGITEAEAQLLREVI